MIVHTLHLSRRQDRYDSITKEAEEQGFKIQFHEAIDSPKNTKQAIANGHKSIIQYAKDNNLPRVIVCEDDAKFTHPNSFKYFLSQIPQSYDVFFAMYYMCNKLEGNRILGEASGICTLYCVSQRFYDTFLSIDSNSHIDRILGKMSKDYEMYVCPLIPVEQSGIFSDHMRKAMDYSVYLENRLKFLG